MSIRGLEKVIQFPGPQRRPYGLLLDVATQLTSAELSQGGTNRVGAGVTYVPWGCDALRKGNVDCDSDWLVEGNAVPTQSEETGEWSQVEEPKPYESYPLTEVQRPFKIVDSLKCSALSMLPEEMDDRLQLRMRELVSAIFADELVTGYASQGLSLAAQAEQLTTPFSTFPDLSGEAAAIERFLADNLNGAWGIVHIPVELLALAKYLDWVSMYDGVLRTCTGHYVVADAGNSGKIGPGEDELDDNEFWIYATGPVYYHLTDSMLLGDNSNEVFDIEENIRRRIAEAVGLVAFDPCQVAAVKVTLGGGG